MNLDYPLLYQINTRVWLTDLSAQLGRKATLDDVTDAELDALRDRGFQWIWLLSVWTTGNVGRDVSRANRMWRAEFQETLPDLMEEDIAGSGFAIAGYRVSAAVGGPEALQRFRRRLQARNLKLMLDFVPNHTAIDHFWVSEHPEYYVDGHDEDVERSPQNYFRLGQKVFAYGRDPYFAGWPDTIQLDYSNPTTQEAMTKELLQIAQQCDGVRCDMAMLLLPEVFEKTWGRKSRPFWSAAIKRVRDSVPGFRFMAEVYWDLEWQMQQEGFDYAYDKRLYDRLKEGEPNAIRGHLHASLDYQTKLARFLENHDEPRAAATLPDEVQMAAACITYLAPGLRLFHQGQFEGKLKRISPHLVRGPKEPVNATLQKFYANLLTLLKEDCLHHGQWQMLEATPAWNDNWTHQCFVLYFWSTGTERFLVAVNYAPHRSQCYVTLPLREPGTLYKFADQLGTDVYHRLNDELMQRGFFLDMAPWQYHVFKIAKKERFESKTSVMESLSV